MSNLNKVILIGRLTRDPMVRHTPKGTACTEFGLAANRSFSTETGEKREETTFVDLTLNPNKLADLLPESLTECELDALLRLADETLIKVIGNAAALITETQPENVASLVTTHSQIMLSYLSIRALLCGDEWTRDDDFEDLGIF